MLLEFGSFDLGQRQPVILPVINESLFKDRGKPTPSLLSLMDHASFTKRSYFLWPFRVTSESVFGEHHKMKTQPYCVSPYQP